MATSSNTWTSRTRPRPNPHELFPFILTISGPVVIGFSSLHLFMLLYCYKVLLRGVAGLARICLVAHLAVSRLQGTRPGSARRAPFTRSRRERLSQREGRGLLSLVQKRRHNDCQVTQFSPLAMVYSSAASAWTQESPSSGF